MQLSKKILSIFILFGALAWIANYASADCGPVPPGMKQDKHCNLQPNPPPPASGVRVVKPCDQDADRQKSRSQELQKIVSEDQSDREIPYEKINWRKVGRRDEARRKRVEQIFNEGCFKSAADYAAAALVYQHGVIPDHYFKTFLWAKNAVELGDQKSKWLMAAGIDRYLVHTGHKQLFATQAGKSEGSPCWCLNQVESTFPSDRRLEYANKTLEQALAWVDSMNSSPTCKPAKFCAEPVKDSPVGTVHGFW